MYFNFKLFTGLTITVYNTIGIDTYTIAEVLEVFRYYFEAYEEYTGTVHPPIRKTQIEQIIRAMPYAEDANLKNREYYIDPDSYPYMIDQHFNTRYRNCDYNINHFFSGNIRLLRFYETCY